ncbi:MAG: MoaD/ThiS family protein [Gammaproteobacteria bacterium]|nr:MoaD/ThiS family protein [Gammaproteobacteria bacterium]
MITLKGTGLLGDDLDDQGKIGRMAFEGSLAGLCEQLAIDPAFAGYLSQVNGEIVHETDRAKCLLKDGDTVTLISPVTAG